MLDNSMEVLLIVWTIADVQYVCPGLDKEQCWFVLMAVNKTLDVDKEMTYARIRDMGVNLFGAHECGRL